MPSSPLPPRLAERLGTPLRAGLLCGFAMACLSLLAPNQYRSEARLLPASARNASSLSSLLTAAAAFGVNLPSAEGGDANYEDILQSHGLRERLLATSFRFRTRIAHVGPWRERQETLAQFLDEANPDRSLRRLNDMMRVNRDLKTKLVTVTVETPSPELSQQIAQKAIEYLEAFLLQKGQRSGESKAGFAARALKEAQEAERQAESAFRTFLEGNRFYAASLDPETRLRGARLEADLRLKNQLTVMHTLAHEQALLEEKNDVPSLNILDRGNLPYEKSRPTRSVWVLLAALLGGAATWGWQHRTWIRDRVLGAGGPAR